MVMCPGTANAICHADDLAIDRYQHQGVAWTTPVGFGSTSGAAA